MFREPRLRESDQLLWVGQRSSYSLSSSSKLWHEELFAAPVQALFRRANPSLSIAPSKARRKLELARPHVLASAQVVRSRVPARRLTANGGVQVIAFLSASLLVPLAPEPTVVLPRESKACMPPPNFILIAPKSILTVQVPIRETRQSMPWLRPAREPRDDAEFPGLSAEGADGEMFAGIGDIQQVPGGLVPWLRESEERRW